MGMVEMKGDGTGNGGTGVKLRPLTRSPITSFPTNWKDIDLMGGLFNGHETVPREQWSMAQCPDGDRWQVVCFRGQCWD